MMISNRSKALFTVLFVVIFISHAEAKQSAEIETFIDRYSLYSDLGLYQRADYKKGLFDEVLGVPSHKLGKLISDKCEIIYEKEGKEALVTKKEFIDEIEKTRFTLKVKEVVIAEPQYNCGQDNKNTIVKMTKGLLAGKNIDIVECELKVKENDFSFLITAIKQRYRNPTETEIQEIEAELKRQPYNPRQGLGARYIGGGGFSGTHPSMSPDGNKIVFVSLQYESSEICIMNRDGSEVKRLTDTPYWEINPSFTPDGKSILFISDQDNYEGEPYLLDMKDNSIKRFAPGFRYVMDVCYSPGANYMAFTAMANNKNEIYLMEKNGDNIRQITKTGLEKYSLVFFPDGKKICFSQQWYDDDKHPPRIVEMYSVEIDGNSLKQLTNNREKKQPFAVTSDGVIVFLRQNDSYKDEIWSMKSDGNDVKCLTGQEFHIDGIWGQQIIPGNIKVIFNAWDKKTLYHYHVYSLDVCKDFQLKQLTHEKKNVYESNISPDGRYVVVLLTEDRSCGKGDIGIVPIDGGVAKIIGKNY
jgi:Tol biopolymer transport system component